MADIKLTLGNEPAPAAPNPTAAATAEAPIEEIKEEVQEEVKKQTFSPEEQAQIDEFAKKIDITNSSLVFQYGAGTQQNIASFSDTALNNVRSKDLGEVGDMIAGLVTELRSFNVDTEEKKGLFGFLRQKVDKMQLLKNRYDDVEVNVNKLVNELENHQVQQIGLADEKGREFVRVHFEAPLAGVWSPAGKHAPFICIEPWYGRCDAEAFDGELKDREWGNCLESGACFEASYEIITG